MRRFSSRDAIIIVMAGLGIFALVLPFIPGPRPVDRSRELNHLGMALLLFQLKHQDRFPQNIDELAQAEAWPPKRTEDLKKWAVFTVGGKRPSDLPEHAILAFAKPQRGQPWVSALMDDGGVYAIPEHTGKDLSRGRTGEVPVLVETSEETHVQWSIPSKPQTRPGTDNIRGGQAR